MKDAMSVRLEPAIRDRKIVTGVAVAEDELSVAKGLEALSRIQAKAPEIPHTLDEVNAIIAEARA